MKSNKYKKIIAGCMAIIIACSPAITVLADNRDAGFFDGNQDSGVYMSNSNGKKYYPNNEGGYTVNVPYTQNMTGQEIFKSMFTGLFDIYKSGEGSHYSSAGAKYIANGMTNINGINTSNYAKTLSIGGLNSNLGAITQSEPATTDIHNLSGNNIEFRYSGVIVDKTGSGTVVSNPGFPSDFLSGSSSGGEARSYQMYDKSGNPKSNVTLYGSTGPFVIQRENLIKDWPGTSGVPTNIPNTNTVGMAEETFEKWASTTQIGAAYKEAYSHDVSGLKWWEFLKDYIRIDGNYEKQSVLLTVVYKGETGTVYTTYGIPYPIKSNTVASKIQILDDKKTLLDYSYRDLAMEEAITGNINMNMNMNVISGGAVKLERNKTYNVECAFLFASEAKTTSTTNKSDAGSAPELKVGDQTQSENFTYKSYDTSPTSSLQNLTSEEKGLLDTTTSGAIKTKKQMSVGLTRNGGESISYNAGITAYKNVSVTVDDMFPQNGIIRIVVPETYAQNGDNDYSSDDYLDLKFTLDDAPVIEKEEDKIVSPGDMNLGQRELRSYHHHVVEEVEEEVGADPLTGEPITEMVEYEYEYATEFGTYESPQEGDKVGEWHGVPESSSSIYPIDSESWWEYDQQWPSQSEDAYYKIWLTKNGTSWSQNDEEYYRSETADYPFTLGFSVSKSRGNEGENIYPKIIVSVYGISPETDENGELIETFSLKGQSITNYRYSTINYMYALNKYIAERYATGSSSNKDYPRIRVHAEIDKSFHGESGLYGDSEVSPYNNGWQDEHDSFDRVFEARPDDMELTDVKIKDAEGIVVYHATREDGGEWIVKVKGYYDKEEDYTMTVKLRQNISSGHVVKNPSIDVVINGENKTGGNVSTYVNRTITNNEALGLDVETVYDNIAFRPKDVSAVNFNIEINNIHGSTNWRENIWDSEEDSFSDKIQCTTANLKVSPNIEFEGHS